MRRNGREELFDGFLDYVQTQDGQLIILGDFFELLRYPLDSIIARRGELLDRLADMNTIYVPGNHDEAVFSLVDPEDLPHPFFAGMSDAFTQQMGNRRFRFMHGHEVDPLVNAGTHNLGRMIGAVVYRFELRNGLRACTSRERARAVLQARGRRQWRMTRTPGECRLRTSAERVRLLTRQIRTQHMIMCYWQDKAMDLFDVAVVGHTHHAAAFGGWFFNSGSWTGRNNDFLAISPEGRVNVCDWNDHGAQAADDTMAA